MSSEKDYKNSEFKNFFEKSLLDTDPDIYNAINDELRIQKIQPTSCKKPKRSAASGQETCSIFQ